MTERADVLPASITDQFTNVALLAAEIDATAKHLAQLFERLHGEKCRYMVSHEAGAEVIVISPGIKRGGSSHG
jgi:hypothetical protein